MIRLPARHRDFWPALVVLAYVFAATGSAVSFAADAKPAGDKPPAPVSFYRQVRPILQRECAGCHQPSKQGGKLLLTSYEGLKKGGEGGEGFVAGKPAESTIITMISGEKPEMPKNRDPLQPKLVELITRWIAEGAKDDTPARVEETISPEKPPKYANPPVITALAYSPDSKLLAVSGYHEILVHNADGGGLVKRLVGRAQRLEAIRFSPDGKLIGAVGGSPALFGEVQLWNVADSKLAQSITISYDTLFGASFSDDGSKFAFGGADNRARVINVADGKEIMRFDAHSDWVLGTTFSLKLDHLITISRDMSMKLVIVENAQLVDNITSITPGALKGGLMAVQRHPTKEQVLIGGSDGEPKLYKIFRTRVRVIGDDFNHIRSYDKLPGRIFDLQFNADGSRFVVCSSTAIAGAARIYKTGDYKTEDINNAGGLEDTIRETAERSSAGALEHDLKDINGPIYSVAFRPDGKQVAVGGFEGAVALYDAQTGALVKKFVPVEVAPIATASR